MRMAKQTEEQYGMFRKKNIWFVHRMSLKIGYQILLFNIMKRTKSKANIKNKIRKTNRWAQCMHTFPHSAHCIQIYTIPWYSEFNASAARKCCRPYSGIKQWNVWSMMILILSFAAFSDGWISVSILSSFLSTLFGPSLAIQCLFYGQTCQ